MRNLALVDAHFIPSNLTGVHRPRRWTYHLEDFGWRPIVVTTHWRHYHGQVVEELFELVPDDLEVIRTEAFPTLPYRLIGDVGLRALWHQYHALRRLAEDGRIDFVLITIPSFYSALLGRLLKKTHGVPYGIDYQDPWVHDFPESDVPLGGFKARASALLAKALEPIAVAEADLITGISPSYIEGVFDRNPHLRQQAVIETMQVGIDPKDFDFLQGSPRSKFLWENEEAESAFRFLYAGALLPRARPVLEVLLEALREIKQDAPRLANRLEFYFVGTGSSPDDPESHRILPLAEQYGVADLVFERPDRISYLDVLNHLQAADGALIVGSTEPHYSPSKTYEAVLAETPILALLHQASEVTDIIQKSNTGSVISFPGDDLPTPDAVASALKQFISSDGYDPDRVQWEFFEQFSAREATRSLARALDQAYEQAARNRLESHE